MRPLGVGLVYLKELDGLFRESNPDLSVLELEPSTFWEKYADEASGEALSYTANRELMDQLGTLPQHKLIHSVGFPIGGSASESDAYHSPLADASRELSAAWISEHLSFNAMASHGGIEQIGFLLPPRQTAAGVKVASANIRRLAAKLPAPFAFETGVNYLQPRADELPDGEFFAAVAEEADCGIVLDLHNLWANERNGRQPLDEVLAALPLERVWEVHLAGGMMLDGYYLDAHADVIAAPLIEIARQVICRLPNIGALLFEILPGYVPQIGIDRVREQVTIMAELWRLRPPQRFAVERRPLNVGSAACSRDDVSEWEHELGSLCLGHVPHGNRDAFGLRGDPGISILQKLSSEFRSGRIARALRFSITLLLATLGPRAVHELLGDYERHTCPDVFTSGEADTFAKYLTERMARMPYVPYLAEVLKFEHALVRAALYGAATRVDWQCDPSELLSALELGIVPPSVPALAVSMNVMPTELTTTL